MADVFPPPPVQSPPKISARLPRPGELTPTWRFGMVAIWVAVVLAWSAVWNASVQLGLSTWWLGPRAQPTPQFIKLSPFIPPVLMMLGAINNVRWLAWFGLASAAILTGIGVGDLGRVRNLGIAEVSIALIAGIVSIASLAGTYRPSHPEGDLE